MVDVLVNTKLLVVKHWGSIFMVNEGVAFGYISTVRDVESEHAKADVAINFAV